MSEPEDTSWFCQRLQNCPLNTKDYLTDTDTTNDNSVVYVHISILSRLDIGLLSTKLLKRILSQQIGDSQVEYDQFFRRGRCANETGSIRFDALSFILLTSPHKHIKFSVLRLAWMNHWYPTFPLTVFNTETTERESVAQEESFVEEESADEISQENILTTPAPHANINQTDLPAARTSTKPRAVVSLFQTPNCRKVSTSSSSSSNSALSANSFTPSSTPETGVSSQVSPFPVVYHELVNQTLRRSTSLPTPDSPIDHVPMTRSVSEPISRTTLTETPTCESKTGTLSNSSSMAKSKSSEKKRKTKTIVDYIQQNGEEKFWQIVLRDLTKSSEVVTTQRQRTENPNALPLTIECLSKVIKDVTRAQSLAKKKKLVPILVNAIFQSIDFDFKRVQFDVFVQSIAGTSREMMTTISSCFSQIIGKHMPTRRQLSHMKAIMRLTFMEDLKLTNTYSGMRVSLVESVKFCSTAAYGISSLKDLKVDIWGDGMKRGKTEITRFCFRILDIACDHLSEGQESNTNRSQSRKHIFCFCAFVGKDSRFNIESNCGSGVYVGERGWLFEETKALSDLGCVVTLSGDCPFLNRMLGVDDSGSHEMGIWLDKNELASKITPLSTDKLGYRTGIKLPLRTELPSRSLIYLKDVAHVVPDVCHAGPRMCEKDMKLFFDKFLNAGNRVDHIRKLIANINSRNVKNNEFTVNFEHGNVYTSKKVGDISFCGEDSRVIYAPASLVGEPDGLFEGVLRHDICVVVSSHVSVKIIKELHKGLPSDVRLQLFKINDSSTIEGLSERAVGDLMMLSAHNFFTFCRDPTKNLSDISELETWIETYFQCNLILFGDLKWTTPYKSKMIVLPELLRRRGISSIFNHMAEGMENSNHGANRWFHRHSMRDGGTFNRSTSSEFDDLFFSYVQILHLEIERTQVDSSSAQSSLQYTWQNRYSPRFTDSDCDTAGEAFWKEYLRICRTKVSGQQLNFANSGGSTLKGLSFHMMGSFGQLFVPITSANGKKIVHTKVTTPVLKTLITELGGNLLSDGIFKGLCDSETAVGHTYIVLQDDTLFKSYMDPKGKESKCFNASTRCNFKYIRAQFILDCYNANKLLDPNEQQTEETANMGTNKYLFTFNTESFVRNQKMVVSRKVERQRSTNNIENVPTRDRNMLAKSRLKKNLRLARQLHEATCMTVKDNHRKFRTNQRYASLIKNIRGRKLSVIRARWMLFRKCWIQRKCDIDQSIIELEPRDADHRRKDINLTMLTYSAASYWRELSMAEKAKWGNIAEMLMGLKDNEGIEKHHLIELGAELLIEELDVQA